MCRPTRRPYRGRLIRLGEMSEDDAHPLHRGTGGGTYTRKAYATVAERFVVPVKPGNSGGGKGPQFKTDARRGEGPGDWATYQLRTAFRNCRRRCTRKRRQNPRPLRQAQPRRHPGARLCPVPLQQGRAGRGPSGLRGRRGVWGRAMFGRTGACAQAGDLPTGPHQTRLHTEGQRQTQAAGHLNLAGSGLHDSSDAGAGTDLRGRPSLGTLCLPSRATLNRRWSRWRSWCFAAIRKWWTPTSRTTSGAFRMPTFSSRQRAGSSIGACFI